MATLAPKRVWWDPICGPAVETDEKPEPCGKGHCWSDLGWRVGHTERTSHWYSTLESAMRDKLVKGRG